MARNLDPQMPSMSPRGEKAFLKGEKCFYRQVRHRTSLVCAWPAWQKSGQRLSDYGVPAA